MDTFHDVFTFLSLEISQQVAVVSFFSSHMKQSINPIQSLHVGS